MGDDDALAIRLHWPHAGTYIGAPDRRASRMAMATVDIFTDPPAEQLYDELLSRLWALHQLADFPVADIAQPETTRRTEGDPTPITAVLWPNRAPPPHSDAWWRTPLGELLTHYWARAAAHPSTSPHP